VAILECKGSANRNIVKNLSGLDFRNLNVRYLNPGNKPFNNAMYAQTQSGVCIVGATVTSISVVSAMAMLGIRLKCANALRQLPFFHALDCFRELEAAWIPHAT
jgi:hypothetical protein